MFLLTVKKKFIRNITLLTLGLSAICGLIFWLFIPQWYFVCLLAIPVYFYLFGLFNINLVQFVFRHDGGKLVPAFLLCKGIKLFASLIFLLFFGVLFRSQFIPFAVVFAVFYLIYLVFETHFALILEIKLRKRKGSF